MQGVAVDQWLPSRKILGINWTFANSEQILKRLFLLPEQRLQMMKCWARKGDRTVGSHQGDRVLTHAMSLWITINYFKAVRTTERWHEGNHRSLAWTHSAISWKSFYAWNRKLISSNNELNDKADRQNCSWAWDILFCCLPQINRDNGKEANCDETDKQRDDSGDQLHACGLERAPWLREACRKKQWLS